MAITALPNLETQNFITYPDDVPAIHRSITTEELPTGDFSIFKLWHSYSHIYIEIEDNELRNQLDTIEAISHVKDAITQIRKLFSFNVTEVAEIFGQSRPTIYNWLKSDQVKTEISAKLLAMVTVAQHWSSIPDNENLSFLFDYKGTHANDVSIREALKEAVIDADALKALIDNRLAEYNANAKISLEIIGEVDEMELAEGPEIPEGKRRLNQLWTQNIKAFKNAQNKEV